MIKKVIKCHDFDGNEVSVDAWFHLNKAELLTLETHTEGGLNGYLTKISRENDTQKIFDLFTDIIKMAYGKRIDGVVFDKTPEDTRRFMNSEAYSELLVELLDPDKAAEFINGLLPQDMRQNNNPSIPAPSTI